VGAIEIVANSRYYDHPVVIQYNSLMRTQTTGTPPLKIPAGANNKGNYIYRDNQAAAPIDDAASDWRTPPDNCRLNQSREMAFNGLYRVGARWLYQAVNTTDVPKTGVFDRMEFVGNRNSAVGLRGWNVDGIGERLGAYKNPWAISTAWVVGEQVKLTNGKVLVCVVAGSSSATTEPTAPTNFFDTVVDGSVTWKYIADGPATFLPLDSVISGGGGGAHASTHEVGGSDVVRRLTASVIAVTGNKTMGAADRGSVQLVTSASAVTLTLEAPATAGAGASLMIIQGAAGQATITATPTPVSPEGKLKTRVTGSAITVVSDGTNWYVSGDLSA
jgi:hypothetical protein